MQYVHGKNYEQESSNNVQQKIPGDFGVKILLNYTTLLLLT